ncbi:MAG: hypothetical protein ABI190_11805 [Casimicrobiaceae bacterium]
MIVVLILAAIANRKFLPSDPQERAKLWRHHVAFWCKVAAGAFVLAIVLAGLVRFFAPRG